MGQKTRVIALSCGIKIPAVHHLVLSQSTRVADRRTDRQNYDSQDRSRICSRGKNRYTTLTVHACIVQTVTDKMPVHVVADDGVYSAAAVRLDDSLNCHICGRSVSASYRQNDRRWRRIC